MAEAIARRPGRGPDPARDRGGRGLDEHRLGRRHARARRRRRARGLWLHVDAAYGGAARLSRRDAHRVPGLERADCVTVDPHKWFFQAYDIGALVVRRREDLLTHLPPGARVLPLEPPRGRAAGLVPVLDRGHAAVPRPEALDELEAPGHRRAGRPVEHNDDLAALPGAALRDAEDFEAGPCEPELSVVCFRHLPAGHDAWTPDADRRLPGRLQRALEVSGRRG